MIILIININPYNFLDFKDEGSIYSLFSISISTFSKPQENHGLKSIISDIIIFIIIHY